MSEEPQTEDPMVAALLREREGYVGRGMDDRVAQVDEQLALRGHKLAGKSGQSPTRSTPPKGRQQRGPEKT
ncbi:hypothetical protein ACFUTV_38685 [Streptomyces sp. NPDC057298]|uniref:hypothetical protein n=1 Tax=Streptomyces sp. NPDC057298 TaxID=3346091 RepID=UPI003634F834